MEDFEKYEREAYELGAEHARIAASWVDGNTSHDAIVRVVAMLDAGDPEAYDYLPREPNLSGEWADDLTPLRLVTEIAGDEIDPDPIIDAVCEAYERGVSDTFEPECERILRAAVMS